MPAARRLAHFGFIFSAQKKCVRTKKKITIHQRNIMNVQYAQILFLNSIMDFIHYIQYIVFFFGCAQVLFHLLNLFMFNYCTVSAEKIKCVCTGARVVALAWTTCISYIYIILWYIYTMCVCVVKHMWKRKKYFFALLCAHSKKMVLPWCVYALKLISRIYGNKLNNCGNAMVNRCLRYCADYANVLNKFN